VTGCCCSNRQWHATRGMQTATCQLRYSSAAWQAQPILSMASIPSQAYQPESAAVTSTSDQGLAPGSIVVLPFDSSLVQSSAMQDKQP
jgi:hypothetical protein